MSGSTEERLVAIADQRAGRVIPVWRYWLAYSLVGVAWIVSPLVRDWPFVLSAVVIIGLFTVFGLLLSQFKQRSIR